MKELRINIQGMSCKHCKMALEGAIGQMEGVNSVEVDLASNSALIHVEDEAMLQQIKKVIQEAGYQVK
jgi:copper chaperone